MFFFGIQTVYDKEFCGPPEKYIKREYIIFFKDFWQYTQ